jgi:hypothetical protein
MTLTSPINKNIAIVDRVLDGGQTIILHCKLGGRFSCRNQGFEVGDVVCYTIDPLTQQVVHLLPKDVADLKVMLARDPDLQLAIVEDSDVEQVITIDSSGYGQETEIDPDLGRGDSGEQDPIGSDYTFDPADLYDPAWVDGYDHMGEEAPGETDSVQIHLSVEQECVQGLVLDEPWDD